MSLSKLKKLHVIIIGSVLCVGAAVAMFMLMVKPQQAQLLAKTKELDSARVLGTPEKLNEVLAALADARIKVSEQRAKFDVEMKRRMPDLSFERRKYGMLQLWDEQINVLGPLLKSFAKDKSVTVLQSNIQIPAPPVNPNDAIFDQDVLVFPLGTIQVQGDFKGVMENVRRWNNCRRLVMVSTPPALGGISPNLVASYSLTCYIFPITKGGEKIQMAGGGTATGQPGM